MDLPRLSRSVRRITILERDANGDVTPSVVFKRDRGRKKSSAAIRPFERVVRAYADSGEALTRTYLRRHKKSNRKRRDGWLRDYLLNATKAGRKGINELDPGRLFNF
jgi:hypothetical protein